MHHHQFGKTFTPVMRDQTLVLLCTLALANAGTVRFRTRADHEVYADPKLAPTICAVADSDGILVAHEHCSQYYQCWDGNPIARYCYGDLQYNPLTGICDWPHSVECGVRITPERHDEQDNADDAPAICASEGSEELLIAHSHCDKFYKCLEGRAVTYKCPGLLLYNTAVGYCDCSSNVICGDRVITESEKESDGNNNGNDDPSEATSICVADDSDGVFVAHVHCNMFYKCNHGKPVEFECFGDLLFNPAEGHCDWSENVDCGDRTIPEKDSVENSNESESYEESDNGSDNEGSGTCNCSPGEAPNLCAQDGSEGVLIAHDNCCQYYKCVHGVPIAQTCPSGLLYNPYKEQCDWPDNVECGDRAVIEKDSSENADTENGSYDNSDSENGSSENGGTDNEGSGSCNCNPGEAPSLCAKDGSEGTLIAHENCCQYYQCVHGVPVVQTCPSGLLYNSYKEQCDWPDNVQCGDRVIPEKDSSENGGTENGGTDNDSTENGGSDNGNSGTCNCNPGEAPILCANDGSDGTLVAHENCNKYYICVHGQPVTQRCQHGLLYNPNEERCDWADNVKCGDRVIFENHSEENKGSVEESDDGGSENGGTDHGGSGTCNCNPGEAPTVCAQDDSDGVLIAHKNCGKFYQCIHGLPVAQSCPSGLMYNPYRERCDWPDNVECGDRTTHEEDCEEDNNENDSTGNEDSDNSGSENGDSGFCNCNPGEAPNLCAQDGSDGKLIAHENCNKYYICVHGQPVAQQCQNGLLYNPYEKRCYWASDVECGSRVVPDEDCEDNNNGSEDTDSTGDNNGSENESNIEDCYDDPSQATRICGTDGSDGIFVAHENCNQFYVCLGGEPIVLDCPNNLLYNLNAKQCDWPENVLCGDRVISKEDNKSNENTSNEDSGNGGSGTCNCNPGEAPRLCMNEGSDGVLVAHENCNKFYQCVHGLPVVQQCQNGLLYNPYSETCDWPDNVECGERLVPEEDCEDNNNEDGSETDDGDNGGSENGGSDNGSNVEDCHDDPSQAPTICARVDSEGTFVAHENCNQFYICLGGKPVVLDCPTNLLYNPNAKQCDWPQKVNCSDRLVPKDENKSNEDSGSEGSSTCNCNPDEAPGLCANEGSDGVLVAHENCNKFYQCVHGFPVVLQCQNGLLYNPYSETCDWAEDVECRDRIVPEKDDEDDNNENGSENESGDNDETGNGGSDGDSNIKDCHDDPSQAPTICARDNSEGTLVAHENCNQFYVCVGGQPVVLNCPNNLLYNPIIKECNWSENVKCGDRIIPNSNEDCDDNDNFTGEETTTPKNISDGDSTEQDSNDIGDGEDQNTEFVDDSKAAEYCQTVGSDSEFLPHQNCNKFYTCVGSKSVVLSCAGDLLYNCQTKRCEFAEHVECGNRLVPNSSDNGEIDQDSGDGKDEENVEDNKSYESTEKESAEKNDNDGNENIDTDDQANGNDGVDSEVSEYCALSGSEERVLPHENCNQYYICIGGVPVVRSCSGQFLFNANIGLCDWPQNVNCNNQEAGGAAENGGSSGGGGNNGEDDENTDVGEVQSSEEEEETNESNAAAICSLSGSNNRVVPHDNCRNYYICINSEPQVRSCSGQFLFNANALQCDWPQNVDCGNRVL